MDPVLLMATIIAVVVVIAVPIALELHHRSLDDSEVAVMLYQGRPTGEVRSFRRLVLTRGQDAFIVNTLPVKLPVPPFSISTGGGNKPDEVAINACYVELQIVDPVRSYYAPGHEPLRNVVDITPSFTKNDASRFSVTQLMEGDMETLEKVIAQKMSEYTLKSYGVEIRRIELGDPQWPRDVLEQSARERQAEAARYEIEQQTEAEVDKINHLKEAMGPDVYEKQLDFDNLEKIAKAGWGGVYAPGGMDPLTALLLGDRQKKTRRKPVKKTDQEKKDE